MKALCYLRFKAHMWSHPPPSGHASQSSPKVYTGWAHPADRTGGMWMCGLPCHCVAYHLVSYSATHGSAGAVPREQRVRTLCLCLPSGVYRHGEERGCFPEPRIWDSSGPPNCLAFCPPLTPFPVSASIWFRKFLGMFATWLPAHGSTAHL